MPKKLFVYRAYVSKGSNTPDFIVAVHAPRVDDANKRVHDKFGQFEKFELAKEWGTKYLDVIEDGHIQMM